MHNEVPLSGSPDGGTFALPRPWGRAGLWLGGVRGGRGSVEPFAQFPAPLKDGSRGAAPLPRGAGNCAAHLAQPHLAKERAETRPALQGRGSRVARRDGPVPLSRGAGNCAYAPARPTPAERRGSSHLRQSTPRTPPPQAHGLIV
ncbi:hypothetical protein GCM10010372_61760 [Streptomyces tauricus]|nr:hypothetical protein GCM10010372_61760 [Streptomyces tauricus]